MGVILVLGLGNGSGSPVVLFHRARHHGRERIAFLPLLGEGSRGEGLCAAVPVKRDGGFLLAREGGRSRLGAKAVRCHVFAIG